MVYLLGIVGWRVERSLSPFLHTAALGALGLRGEYRIYPVEPGDESAHRLRELLALVQHGRLTGLNITMPFKEAVLPWVDDLTDEARAIGAVNTVYRRSDALIGDNTDARGFIADLQAQGGRQEGVALILGAGGAARAVAFALATRGWKVYVAARRFDQAQRLALDLGRGACLGIEPLTLAAGCLEEVRLDLTLLVNATPVGSASQGDGTPWPPGLPLPVHAVVYDLVYDPRETPLMKMAREAGLMAIGGMGMLVEQAALAFEHWTGHTAPRHVMLKAAREAYLDAAAEG